MSDDGDKRPKYASAVAQAVESLTYNGGQLVAYVIIFIGIVGTWGDPDLIDAVVARVGGVTLECTKCESGE